MNFFGPSDRILLMDSAEIKELSESCAFLLLLKRPQRGGVIQMFRIPRPSINVKDLLIHTKCTQQKTTKIAPLCGISFPRSGMLFRDWPFPLVFIVMTVLLFIEAFNISSLYRIISTSLFLSVSNDIKLHFVTKRFFCI